MSASEQPTHATVAELLGQHSDAHPDWSADHIERLPTGLCHYVFAVFTGSGAQLVVRIAQPANAHLLRGNAYWHGQLQDLPVPLAQIFYTDVYKQWPYQIMSRLPGTDLGHAYGECSAHQLRQLAQQMVSIQNRVAALGVSAPGYGFATARQDARLRTWNAAISGQIQRIHGHLTRGGIFDAAGVLAPVMSRQAALQQQLEDHQAIPPTMFLPDTTTKNVLIQGGALTGIVDLDEVCFGDRLFTLALTRMSLLARTVPTTYTDQWQALLQLDVDAKARLDFYTLLFCTDFMGEINQQFNQAAAEIDDEEVANLTRLHQSLS